MPLQFVPRVRVAVAAFAAHLTAWATRLARMGAGTSLPGLVAERLHPAFARDAASQLAGGIVLVTGTNGKTTTSAMLSTILADAGLHPVSNASGSNLHRGVTCALALAPRAARMAARAAVFEVDENALPQVAVDVAPAVISVTNVLRDQLDRYGETDSVVKALGRGIDACSASVLVLNADDPAVSGLATDRPNPVLFYAVESEGPGPLMTVAESAQCPACGGDVAYRSRTYAHLGDWACGSCGTARPRPTLVASGVETSAQGCSFTLTAPGWEGRVSLSQPGLHNVYNAVAAIGCAVALGVDPAAAATSIAKLDSVFGRTETLQVEGRDVTLLLAKNPVGLSLALSTAVAHGAGGPIALALNDNAADGRDISWIWDAGLDGFDLGDRTIVASGTRAEDMALRLKYAGLPAASIGVVSDPRHAVRQLVRAAAPDEIPCVVATYTAMVAIRDAFAPRGDRFASLGRVMKRGL